jgi:hypothetical protein
MRQFNSATAFMLALLLLIGGLFIGSLTFFNRMNGDFILIQRGNEPVKYVTNQYKFVQNKRGFIFSVTFLVAAASIMIMIALPTVESKAAMAQKNAPQPVRADREESSISAVVEPERAQPESPPESAAPPPSLGREEPPAEEVIDIIETVEEISTDFDDVTEGEDDVVYGTGPISDAAIMHFVHKFPDSAIKFLFRKQLDGKALTSVEESIYTTWENRHLTRGKVKGYILTLMDWKEFPKKPLYEVWKEIRDHIYENID